MNYLAIDYGTKNIGLAVAISGIINPISPIKNGPNMFAEITKICHDYHIDKIYVGVSEGKLATKTMKFIRQLTPMIKLSIETVEEAVSTIEATEIFKRNGGSKKDYKQQIDSIAAAVILNRVISLN